MSVEKDHPTTLYAKLLRSMREPELSKDGPRDAKGVLIDSAWQWREYKAKYWDNVDLTDDRLIRTPIFHNKLSYYYTKVIIQNPDTLIRDGDELLSRMNPKTTCSATLWCICSTKWRSRKLWALMLFTRTS